MDSFLEWASTMPEGTRVLVTGECFPHWIGKREPGVVSLNEAAQGHSVWIRLDRHDDGLDEWDNEVAVSPEDWSDGSAHSVVLEGGDDE